MALFAQGEPIIAKEQMGFSSIICLLFENGMSLCENVHEKLAGEKNTVAKLSLINYYFTFIK